MAESYTFHEECGPREGEPYVVFFNTTESDVFEFPFFGIEELDTPAATLLAYGVELSMIDSASGGTEITMTPHRSDSASLSGDVTVRVAPDVTVSSVLRCFSSADPNITYAAGGTYPLFYRQTVIGRYSAHTSNGCDIINAGKGSVTDIILGEGRGVALSIPSGIFGTTAQMRKISRYCVELSIGGNSYSATIQVPDSYSNRHLLSIFNESGSGVTCSIKRITEQKEKSGVASSSFASITYGARDNPSISILRIDSQGILPYGARDAVTLTPMRSSATSLTGKLLALKGNSVGNFLPEFTTSSGARRLAAASEFPEFVSAANHRAWGSANCLRKFKPPRHSGDSDFAMKIAPLRQTIHKTRDASVRINPGEGIAVLCTGGHAQMLPVFGTINYIANPATYPAVGDVDSGVTYGPNATDYTGTLVQPAESDVLAGVDYGAGGTEFTGTATGGGGGNTYSRGRITNA